MADDLDYAAERLWQAGRNLPDVERSTSYGTPALKVRKKLMARVKDADTVVLACAPEEKKLLKEAAPDIYFETPHYHGYPLVLARIRVISDAELANRLKVAWRMQAPVRLQKSVTLS
ncbi:MAG: MmcQ/YjbR family DNA-binding protein [Rhizobiaceae bacterium]|nr:MmcQ/YjbR family DNA-binding protein [Rhizobiaceae bacterium]